MSGVSAEAFVPGGSASYATFEKTTRPKRLPVATSFRSVSPIRLNVSDEMLAERSSTTTSPERTGSELGCATTGCRLAAATSSTGAPGELTAGERDGRERGERGERDEPAGERSRCKPVMHGRRRRRMVEANPAGAIGGGEARGDPERRPASGRGHRPRAGKAGGRDRPELQQTRAVARKAPVRDAEQRVAEADSAAVQVLHDGRSAGHIRGEARLHADARRLDRARVVVDLDVGDHGIAVLHRAGVERGREAERPVRVRDVRGRAEPGAEDAERSCGASRHRRSHRARLRRSAHSRNALWTDSGSLPSRSTGSSPSEANMVSSSERAASRRLRSARASDRVSRTSSTAPSSGSASGTTTGPTDGKLCSQTGSWITTGTSSQRRVVPTSQSSRGGSSRKSERTKTNDPAPSEEADRASWSMPRRSEPGSASKPAMRSRSRISSSGERPRGAIQNGSSAQSR